MLARLIVRLESMTARKIRPRNGGWTASHYFLEGQINMKDIKRWTPDCLHSFSADVTEEMKDWMRQFGVEDHIDRGYYLQIYDDGGVQLCDDTDGGAGIVFDLPDFAYCPICGARYLKG